MLSLSHSVEVVAAPPKKKQESSSAPNKKKKKKPAGSQQDVEMADIEWRDDLLFRLWTGLDWAASRNKQDVLS